MSLRTAIVTRTAFLAALALLVSCGEETAPEEHFSLAFGQTGSGTVTSSPDGIATSAATPAASADFVEGTEVTLTATPETGWQIDDWSGACAGSADTCALTMDADRSAAITFVQIPRTLEVTVGGEGSIESDPAGIAVTDGETSGTATFADGTVVTLTATPEPEWQVDEWTGPCAGSDDTCTLTMDADQEVSVTFVESTHTLEVTTAGSGAVGSDPAGLSVPSGETTGSATFDHGTVVTLTATPDAGWEVESWDGVCEGSAESCEITLDSDVSVSVTFVEITHALAVTVTGSGAVESSPKGISISGDIVADTAEFLLGTVVTLTAEPEVGWQLEGWGGACEGAVAACEITMDADTSATVTFTETIPGLESGETVGPLAADAGDERLYRLPVPDGASSLRVVMEGGSGDADLYVRFGAEPTEIEYDCRPYAADANESCNFGRPEAGTWVIGVFGFTDYSGVSLTATYRIDEEGFEIRIVFDESTSGWTTAQRDVVEAAIRRWEAAIDVDADGIWFDGGCGYSGDEYVDDLMIFVQADDLDGSSSTLAQAGYCERRPVDSFQSGGRVDTGYDRPLPYAGVMTFDEADVESLFDGGLLADVATHEAGHILGIGTLWDHAFYNHIQGPPASPYHVGPASVVEYLAAGGGDSEVPVEPSVRGHWDEVTFDAELMTPSIDGENPMSRITLGALDDMGYGVDYELADPYTLPDPGAISAGAPRAPGVLLRDDIVVYPRPGAASSKAGR